MFIDLNTHDSDRITADIAIIGSGACGLIMARRLAQSGASVVLFESGGFERTPEAESLNAASVHGSLPVWIRARSRFLGGSTNCWGGNNSPLDSVDFNRDWVPTAAWPINSVDLEPYVDDIHDVLHLGPSNFDVDYWRKRIPRIDSELLCDNSARVQTKLIQKTQVGHLGQVLERDLDRSSNVDVYLNAQVVSITTCADGTTVENVVVSSADRSRTATVTAGQVVLASGPENSRLLLNGNDGRGGGIGNSYDQVGRYWIAHHSSLRGWIEPTKGLDWRLYDLTERPIGECRVFGALQVHPDVQRDEQLLNSAAILEPFRPWRGFNTRARAIAAVKQAIGRPSDQLEPEEIDRAFLGDAVRDTTLAVGRTVDEVWRTRMRDDPRIFVRNWCEQFPHPDNRVVLENETDEFGTPRMGITSNLQPEDKRTLSRSFEILGEEFEMAGHGRWRSDFPKGEQWPSGAVNTAHFMGGTRMSSSPETGVVDEHCRVHGVENLWVTGGSVFPTAGVSMVTYTALLLAARTADAIISATTLVLPPADAGGVVLVEEPSPIEMAS